MKLATFAELFRLSIRRLRSEEDYRRFQRLQASLLVTYLQAHGVPIAGQMVADLGSGTGGYSDVLAAAGGRVLSLDLITPSRSVIGSRAHLVANVLDTPLTDGSVDLVFCASLIEHVSDPSSLITEIRRILRPGGYAYISFPPFYSLRGGHEFAPFHLLGERLALRLTRRRHKHPAWVRSLYGANDQPDTYSRTFQRWGLYRMTISRAKRLIGRSGMVIVDMSTRYLPFSAIRWPLVGEVLTWHAQFLLRREGCPAETEKSLQ